MRKNGQSAQGARDAQGTSKPNLRKKQQGNKEDQDE